MDFLPSRAFGDEEDDENLIIEEKKVFDEKKIVDLLIVGRKGGIGEEGAHVIEKAVSTDKEAWDILSKLEPKKVIVCCEGNGGHLRSSSWTAKENDAQLIKAPKFISGGSAVFLQYCEVHHIPCIINAVNTKKLPAINMYL